MDEIKREYLSTERSPVIDPELRDLLPPITDEEREALTADILKNGCYSPMICMEDMTLVDGHHRYDICTEHDIPYRMVVLDFEDKLDAMQWMINTQKGRRNLTKYQLGQIALKMKDRVIAKARAKQAEYHGNQYESGLTTTLSEVQKNNSGIETRRELAKNVGLGEVTMGKIMKIDEDAPELVKQAVAADEITVNAAYDVTRRLMELPEDERAEAVEEYVEAAKAYKPKRRLPKPER